MSPTTPTQLTVALSSLAKLIDHSLLHPTLTDVDIEAGLQLSRTYNVATACVKPYSIPTAVRILAGSDVKVCAVVAFPHGNSTTAVKVFEAREAVLAGAEEIDVVVNVGKVLSGDWDFVRQELQAVNDVVTGTCVGAGGANAGAGGEGAGAGPAGQEQPKRQGLLKVIFENDYLSDEHIVKLCKICTEVGVAFVKTSTGYGFVKQSNGMYSYRGATMPHLRLMRANSGPDVQIKAAGGVRTLDEFLDVMALGVTRVGASATKEILEEAKRRGFSETPKSVLVTLED